MSYSLRCEGKSDYINFNCADSGGLKTLMIECDGSINKDNFDVTTYGDSGFSMKRDGNTITIAFQKNISNFEKEFTIRCVHRKDKNVSLEIYFVQSAQIFSVVVGKDKFILKSDPQKILKKKSEDVIVDIKVNGGRQDFFVKSVYHFKSNKNEKEAFDDGFEYIKIKNGLFLKNYGRTFFENGGGYVITIAHIDDFNITKDIEITYDDITINRAVREAKRKLAPPNKLTQKSQLYMPLDDVLRMIEPEETPEEEVEYRFEIKGLGNDVSEYSINGIGSLQEMDVSLLEDGEPSDLYLNVYSSATWCDARLDETNRKLLIKIRDLPLIVRSCIIHISAYDNSEIYRDIIIKNYPT